VENSWGTDRGDGGRWTMYDDWFTDNVFSVIVHKRHLPRDVVSLLDTEPTILPAWDPMRRAFDR
ncbi:MAG TPA: aminopeptidase, partial [Alphaproteobacteria bacterium]|nr:aminopeptidase [Alphaproteobacteria bacterium]